MAITTPTLIEQLSVVQIESAPCAVVTLTHQGWSVTVTRTMGQCSPKVGEFVPYRENSALLSLQKLDPVIVETLIERYLDVTGEIRTNQTK